MPWATAAESLNRTRAALQVAQNRVRALAGVSDEDLDDAIADRDEKRRQHVDNLGRGLELHLSRGTSRGAEEQRVRLHTEVMELQAALAASEQPRMGSKLTEQVRLKMLTTVLIPPLDAWIARVRELQEEKSEMDRQTGGGPPSMDELRTVHESLKEAKRTLRAAQRRLEDAKDDGDDITDATATLKAARRGVQAAERAMHRERTALASIAAAHFPELLVREALLRIGTDTGLDEEESVRALLVERDLAHYDKDVRLSAKQARHDVWRARYDGEECVLKEYKLDDGDEWKALTKEVKLLNQLAHCPFIADVQAVFIRSADDGLKAYVQLPYYNGGDMLAWLGKNAPQMWRRKALLSQLCEALRHMHSYGIAHGDVKLENVLVSVDGEHATAHLADFESARQKLASTSQSLSTGGGSAFTELYVAPEILQASMEGHAAKPTAAGDMFSYGVCCLFACCLPPSAEAQQQAVRRFAIEDGRRLASWSRDAAEQADPHLLGLLDSLLAVAPSNEEALALRLSAKQVLAHPFHDVGAALEASAQAQAQAAAASHEAVQQLAAAEREAARKQREADWQEAQLRRRQAEQEEKLHAAVLENERRAERQQCEIRRQEKQLEKKRADVRTQEAVVKQAEKSAKAAMSQAEADRVAAADEVARQKAKADQMRRDLAAEKAKTEADVEKKKGEARAEQAKAQDEMKKLAKLQSEKRAMPAYWEKSIAAKVKDGFALLALDRRRDVAAWKALEKMLITDPAKLKQSGADRSRTRHDRLQLACAWRLEHPPMWERYIGGQQQVLRDKQLLDRAHVRSNGGLPVSTMRTASGLPGQLRADVNEAMLMHGTNPTVLLSVLSTGTNERFSGTNAGTAYGDGTYLAEDAGKNDQYVGVDEQYDAGSELHKRLYRHGAHHPGKVYYLLVCRVALGHHVRTQAAGKAATSMDDSRPVFPVSFRELAAVPGVTPPVHYHALLADVLSVGGRYREVIVFHSEQIYPEYVVAYQRFEGARGPL